MIVLRITRQGEILRSLAARMVTLCILFAFYALFGTVSAVALMSGNSINAPKFRALLNGDKDILLNEPHLNYGKAFDAWVDRQENGTGDLGPYGWGWFNPTLKAQASMRARVATGKVKRRKGSEPFAPGSLNILGKLLSKDQKTIRRYCEGGLLPKGCAFRLKSGQWRINYQRFTRASYTQMVNRLTRLGYLRVKARVAKYRKEIKAESDDVAEQIWLAYSTMLAGGYLFPEEVETDEALAQFDIPKEPIPEIWMNAVSGGVKSKTILLIAVRQLFMEGVHLGPRKGVGRIADRLGVSRATLYRRYTGAQLAAAVRAVYQPGIVSGPIDAAPSADGYTYSDIAKPKRN